MHPSSGRPCSSAQALAGKSSGFLDLSQKFEYTIVGSKYVLYLYKTSWIWHYDRLQRDTYTSVRPPGVPETSGFDRPGWIRRIEHGRRVGSFAGDLSLLSDITEYIYIYSCFPCWIDRKKWKISTYRLNLFAILPGIYVYRGINPWNQPSVCRMCIIYIWQSH